MKFDKVRVRDRRAAGGGTETEGTSHRETCVGLTGCAGQSEKGYSGEEASGVCGLWGRDRTAVGHAGAPSITVASAVLSEVSAGSKMTHEASGRINCLQSHPKRQTRVCVCVCVFAH